MYNYPYIPQMAFNPQMQTVQRMQPVEPIVKCWFVNSKQEFDVLRADYNTIYIGINKTTKEIYTKQLLNNGTTEFLSYNQQKAIVEENDDIKSILQKLSNIEKRLGGSYERNDTNVSATGNVGADAKQSANANVSTNDAGKEQNGTNANIA